MINSAETKAQTHWANKAIRYERSCTYTWYSQYKQKPKHTEQTNMCKIQEKLLYIYSVKTEFQTH